GSAFDAVPTQPPPVPPEPKAPVDDAEKPPVLVVLDAVSGGAPPPPEAPAPASFGLVASFDAEHPAVKARTAAHATRESGAIGRLRGSHHTRMPLPRGGRGSPPPGLSRHAIPPPSRWCRRRAAFDGCAREPPAPPRALRTRRRTCRVGMARAARS